MGSAKSVGIAFHLQLFFTELAEGLQQQITAGMIGQNHRLVHQRSDEVIDIDGNKFVSTGHGFGGSQRETANAHRQSVEHELLVGIQERV